MADIQAQINKLKEAGFSDQEVAAHFNAKLSDAGFSKEEIGGFLKGLDVGPSVVKVGQGGGVRTFTMEDINRYMAENDPKKKALDLLPALGATALTAAVPATGPGLLPIIANVLRAGAGGMLGRVIQNAAEAKGPVPEGSFGERFADPLIEGAKMAGWEAATAGAAPMLRPNARALSENPEAQRLLQFTKDQNLPMSPSTILPSRLSRTVEGAVNMFPTGKATTTAFQNRLSKWLIDSRAQVISDLTGIKTGGTGGKRLIAETGDVKAGLKQGSKEAYGKMGDELEKAASGDLRMADGKIISLSKLRGEQEGLKKKISEAAGNAGRDPDVNAMAAELKASGVPTWYWIIGHGERAADYAERISAEYLKRTGKQPILLPPKQNQGVPWFQKRIDDIDSIIENSTDAAYIPMGNTATYLRSLYESGQAKNNKKLQSLIAEFEKRLVSQNPLDKPTLMKADDFSQWQATINRKAAGTDNYRLADQIWGIVNQDIAAFDKTQGTALLDAVKNAKLEYKAMMRYNKLTGYFNMATGTGPGGQEVFQTGKFYNLIMNDKNKQALVKDIGQEAFDNLRDFAEFALKVSEETGKRGMSDIGKIFQGGMVGGGAYAAVTNPALIVPYAAAPVIAWQIMKPRGAFKKWLTEGVNPEKTKAMLKVGGRVAISGDSE